MFDTRSLDLSNDPVGTIRLLNSLDMVFRNHENYQQTFEWHPDETSELWERLGILWEKFDSELTISFAFSSIRDADKVPFGVPDEWQPISKSPEEHAMLEFTQMN